MSAISAVVDLPQRCSRLMPAAAYLTIAYTRPDCRCIGIVRVSLIRVPIIICSLSEDLSPKAAHDIYRTATTKYSTDSCIAYVFGFVRSASTLYSVRPAAAINEVLHHNACLYLYLVSASILLTASLGEVRGFEGGRAPKARDDSRRRRRHWGRVGEGAVSPSQNIFFRFLVSK